MKILQHSSGIIQRIKSLSSCIYSVPLALILSLGDQIGGLKVHKRWVSVWQWFHYLITDHRAAHNNTEYSSAQQKHIACSYITSLHYIS